MLIIILLLSLALFGYACCKAASIADKKIKEDKGDEYEEEDL